MNCTTIRPQMAQTYVNAMSILVEAAVNDRIVQCSAREQAYLNRQEIIAYTLNQLPGLHATSEQGLEYQLEQGRQRYHGQIQVALQRAFAAVLRDPILSYTPLSDPSPQAVLDTIHQMFQTDQIDWPMVPHILAGLLRQESPSQALAKAKVLAQKDADKQAQDAAQEDALTVFFQFSETLNPLSADENHLVPSHPAGDPIATSVTNDRLCAH
ncbi:late competence development ComFB family protein [filamentous cyanobacterium LEGE 11480]|uniref:Late competence development ComFB family protein n=1 Tax=Romeriopsis navalis LEGE 11480 TaxID=2777977 RepID=A0A928Z3R3_9CYAN|nr:late competence development ComFB family protein [Romeriopsis navalis]MBE9029555.1 late competence development ComFB family protein [Romeriopsis navalis LEGE 11480]